MNKGLTALLAFIAGAGCGYGAAAYFLDKKYKDISDKEIESVKEAFKNRKLPDKPDISTMVSKEEEPTYDTDQIVKEYEALYSGIPIRDIPSYEEPEEKFNIFEEANKNTVTDEQLFKSEDLPISVPKEPKNSIQYVTYEEFYDSKYDDYEKVELTLYSDGFLADEKDEIIVDVARSVGNEFMHHIGEFDAETAYVRNTATKTDYEIIETIDTYSEATGNPVYADGYDY